MQAEHLAIACVQVEHHILLNAADEGQVDGKPPGERRSKEKLEGWHLGCKGRMKRL
jgi:hypothetical protein